MKDEDPISVNERELMEFYGYKGYPLIALNEFRKLNRLIIQKLKI